MEYCFMRLTLVDNKWVKFQSFFPKLLLTHVLFIESANKMDLILVHAINSALINA